ncbi:MAG: response regulator transcription factor [Bacteroidia bacterium]|nr:response regulator transcription factor [Bacteroidia bacterium]
MAVTRLLIADPFPIHRAGLRCMLKDYSNFEILNECSNVQDVPTKVDWLKPDVIWWGFPFVENETETVLHNLLLQNHKILYFLSDSQMELYRKRIQDLGIQGGLRYSAKLEDITLAIQIVREGSLFWDNAEVVNSQGNAPHPGVNFTQRETEILRLIAAELTNTEIAYRLHISSRTVETHRRNILLKAGVKNTAGLMRFALENHLI